MGSNDEYQEIYYQLCNGQSLLIPVWVIKRNVNDRSVTKVADLLGRIHVAESLQCRPRDLSIYAKGTRIADYQNGQALEIDLPLGDPKIQGTSKDEPLLVVVPASALQPAVNIANVQPPQLLLSQSAQQGLELMLQEYLAREKTITISNATAQKVTSLMDKMGLPLKGAAWPNEEQPPPFSQLDDGFQWLEDVDEDSVANREAYMKYLRTMLQIPGDYDLVDAQPKKTLLSLDQHDEIVESIRLKGSTDVVIAKSEHVHNDAVRNNIEALLELKKPKNMSLKDHTPQTICEHVAASYLNPKHPVVSVLTDLNKEWTFFWFAFDGDDDDDDDADSEMALYKLRLNGEDAATKAKYLLDSLFDNSVGDKLPNTLAKRQSFRTVEDWLARRKRKRQREFDSGYGDSQDRHSRPPPSSDEADHTSSANEPGADSSISRSGRSPQNNQGGECGRDGEPSMSMADSLSLFAPSASRDVGNELDLLDMVDESEQYEIVRSFVGRHIVPYMTGSAGEQ